MSESYDQQPAGQQPSRSGNDKASGNIWWCDNIKIGHAISSFNQYATSPGGDQPDVVRLHFGLKGNYSFYYKQLDKTFDLIGGHHNIMYSTRFDMVVQSHSPEIETFGIQFPRELFLQFTRNASDPLKRFADQIINGNSVMLSEQWGAVDTSIQQVINQIIYANYKGDLLKLFLLSKSIELLVLSAEACNAAENRKKAYIKSKSDKEKIIAARDLVNDRLQSPPNLSEIARTVGLNEYKLKRGFKEVFDNTVFGYLSDQRLHLAHRYLQDTDKTASEISAELGYATPQHFNNAFKKKFGITPHLVRNNP